MPKEKGDAFEALRNKFAAHLISREPLGGLKSYSHMQGSPAVAYYWDVEELDKNMNGLLESFVGCQ